MRPDERVVIGRSGLRLTRLALGTAPLGGMFRPVEEEVARATLQAAYDAGIRYFDTAPLYGYGLAEQRVGAALGSMPRDSFVLSTKVGRLLRADAPLDETQYIDGEPLYKETPAFNPVFDFSADGVRRSLEESLTRLGMDRVDIALIHDPDRHFKEALTGAFPALASLREQGTLGAIGVGMNQAEMLTRFAAEADFDCFLLAGRYTLLDQVGLQELLPRCVEKGIAILAGGVYNSGILANPQPGTTFNYAPAPPELIVRAQRIAAVCERHAVPLKAAAIQFPLGHPAVASVVIGVRSVLELEENIAMFSHPIPDDLWRDLKETGLLPEEAPTPSSGEGEQQSRVDVMAPDTGQRGSEAS